MITNLPSGSAALSIGKEGNAMLVVTSDDVVSIYVDSPLDTLPVIITLGSGQAAFDEMKSHIARMEIFTGN